MILDQTKLLDQLKQELRTAEYVDLAVAWIRLCPALNALIEFGKKHPGKLRVIVGISGFITQPDAISNLSKVANIRLNSGKNGIFHPKFYFFKREKTSTAWIGSANLSNSAYSKNNELVFVTTKTTDAQKWFHDLWNNTSSDFKQDFADYKNNWSPSKGRILNPSRPDNNKPHLTKEKLLLALKTKVKSSQDYLDALKQCDVLWRKKDWGLSIFDDDCSYFNTIWLGRDVIHRSTWSSFSEQEQAILLGHRDDGSGYGLLGSMKGAGEGKNVFKRDNSKARTKIKYALQDCINTTVEDFPHAAQEAVNRITTIKGVSLGIASRLLTLGFPDMAISVNNGSVEGLHKLTGRKKGTIKNSRKYGELLKQIHDLPWFKDTPPAHEKDIWSMRAALIDSFVHREL